MSTGPTRAQPPRSPLRATILAEIIFTSGATADPKGVIITHRNILANIVPVETEIRKYRRYGGPFFPLRFLNLLPLSHMFGQAMATFIPPMLPGVVVFMRGYSPVEIVRADSRAADLGAGVGAEDSRRPARVRRAAVSRGRNGAARRRDAGRGAGGTTAAFIALFGMEVLGVRRGRRAARAGCRGVLGELGFLDDPGLRPDRNRADRHAEPSVPRAKGTVGKPIAGVEVKIAPDGEILVRGENVSSGYFGADRGTLRFEGGWFHTGDIGEIDAEGRLSIKGRKKEMIVTPEGLNVFPEDVERVLDEIPGVQGIGGRGQRTAFTRCWCSSPEPMPTRLSARRTASSKIISASKACACGRNASCRAPKARAS